MSGWLALSPLIVFLGLYLVSSIIANDFYKIPISAAFLIASIYAIIICRGKSLEERISIFSEGAGNKNVLLMIWIFVLAGAFAATAKQIGAIDATVNLALRVLPGKLLYAGLFLASCFISMSIGTSVGTIVALVPVAAGIAQEIEVSNRAEGAGEIVLCGVIAVRASAHGNDDISCVQILREGAAGADADDVFHTVVVVQLVGVDADRGLAHARGHDRNALAVVVAGVAVYAAHVVDEDGIREIGFCDEFRAKRIAGHQNGLGEITELCGNMRR